MRTVRRVVRDAAAPGHARLQEEALRPMFHRRQVRQVSAEERALRDSAETSVEEHLRDQGARWLPPVYGRAEPVGQAPASRRAAQRMGVQPRVELQRRIGSACRGIPDLVLYPSSLL